MTDITRNVSRNVEWKMIPRGTPVRMSAPKGGAYIASLPEGDAVAFWGSTDAKEAQRTLDAAVKFNGMPDWRRASLPPAEKIARNGRELTMARLAFAFDVETMTLSEPGALIKAAREHKKNIRRLEREHAKEGS